jgi:hypothetical protein
LLTIFTQNRNAIGPAFWQAVQQATTTNLGQELCLIAPRFARCTIQQNDDLGAQRAVMGGGTLLQGGIQGVGNVSDVQYGHIQIMLKWLHDAT